jgi:hypothetical protein
MSDPVFGITYDTSQVQFDAVPTSVRERCRELPRRQLWVYAHFKNAGMEFFVLSSPQSEVSGIGLVIHGSRCIEALPDWVLTGDIRYWSGKGSPGIRFTDAILQGLATDLLRRYTAAFGDKRTFLEQLRKAGLPLDDHLPTLRHAFEEFSRTSK